MSHRGQGQDINFQGTMLHGGIRTKGKDPDVRRGVMTIQENPVGRIIFAQTVDSSPVTNTSAATAFDQFATIPANSLRVGDALRIRTSGIVTSSNAADTLKLTLGLKTTFASPTVIASTASPDVSDNDIWMFDSVLTFDDLTNGFGRFRGRTLFQDPGASGTALQFYPTGVSFSAGLTSFDILVEVLAEWSVANPGNSCKQETMVVELYGGWANVPKTL